MTLQVQDQAPGFQLPASDGSTFDLEKGLSGSQGLLLAFFPFAWSPVCTNEVGYLNTNLGEFKKKQVKVAAISADSPFTQKAWAKAEGLKFPLLADFNREVIAQFGVVQEEFHGLRGFAKRSVFLLDPERTVRYAWVSDDPGVEPNYAEVLGSVEAL